MKSISSPERIFQLSQMIYLTEIEISIFLE